MSTGRHRALPPRRLRLRSRRTLHLDRPGASDRESNLRRQVVGAVYHQVREVAERLLLLDLPGEVVRLGFGPIDEQIEQIAASQFLLASWCASNASLWAPSRIELLEAGRGQHRRRGSSSP